VRTIAIIGSIGTQTLDVVRANADIRIGALAAGNNIELLEKQVREFRPALVSVQSKDKADALRIALSDFNCKIVYGMDGLIAVATYEPAELVVTAIVGMIGIRPTIEAIKAGKDIALANKETLVTAGHLIMKLAEEYHVRILPVDSEHSAIFQCLHGERENKIAKLLITASGGPFLGKTREELKDVTVEDALKHPNWSMGRKITIDSATLVNKGLEVIEARWLFDVMPEDIEVVVQPQSIIHSMVEFEDGAIKAQLGTADMRLPIQYALYYPERRYLAGDRLDFSKIAGIITSKPDRETFKGLDFAYQAIKTGGSMPTVLNAANECAVAKFLHKDIKFLQIYDIIEACMGEHKTIANPTLEEILETERCIVRELELSDLDDLFSMYAEPGMTDYMEGLYEYEEELEYQKAYIENMYRFYGYGIWLVFEKKTGTLIGRAGVEHREELNGDMELGYAIRTSFQHQGYAYEVCQAIMQYAGEELQVHLLHCLIQKENALSEKLAIKLGFSYCGDREIDGVLMSDYQIEW